VPVFSTAIIIEYFQNIVENIRQLLKYCVIIEEYISLHLENILGVMEYILQLQQFFLDDGPSKSDWTHYFLN
jgi:hypothetical protein